MKVRAAAFDVFGTVVDWRSGVAAVMETAFRAKGIAQDAAAFADAWRGEYQPAMQRIRSGARGYVPLDDLHRENLDIVLAARGLGGMFPETERADLARAWEQLPPWADSVGGLEAIRAKVPVATCSNGSIALMLHLARFAGLRWDAILGADIARDYKPQAAAYLATCAALRLPPGEVLMVACHNDDLAAARAAGLLTAFVARPDELGPGLGAKAPTADWDFVAPDFHALAAMLS